MKETVYTVRNPICINPRRAQMFTKLMTAFASAVKVYRGGDSCRCNCNGKDLYELLNLQVRMNDTITVQAVGIDEEETINTAVDFLKRHL